MMTITKINDEHDDGIRMLNMFYSMIIETC